LKPLIVRHASENGLPYELADAVVRLESRYNAGARNGPNMGLTQINVRTAQALGYQGSAAGLLDAETNLRYGLKYLAKAYKLAGGDTCGTILRYQFGHRTQTMTSASRAYCAKVKVIAAAAE
jgi:soluble lytic murein transglycosylase-like protein